MKNDAVIKGQKISVLPTLLFSAAGKIKDIRKCVTMDVKKAVEDAKGGAIEYRAEKTGIVHAGVGKSSFDEKKIIENIQFFIDTIQKNRPSGAKGTFIKKITLSTTMGPGIKVDLDAGQQAKAA